LGAVATKVATNPNLHPKGNKIMNLIESIKSQREKLDAAVRDAEEKRNQFVELIARTVGGMTPSGNRRSNRRPMSEAQRRKLSESKKKYWQSRKAAKNCQD
jgi:hypothetical protein